MLIDREKGAVRSQRLINAMLEAKRDNIDITKNELNYIAFGYQASGR